jgi:hypothetical protein
VGREGGVRQAALHRGKKEGAGPARYAGGRGGPAGDRGPDAAEVGAG